VAGLPGQGNDRPKPTGTLRWGIGPRSVRSCRDRAADTAAAAPPVGHDHGRRGGVAAGRSVRPL